MVPLRSIKGNSSNVFAKRFVDCVEVKIELRFLFTLHVRIVNFLELGGVTFEALFMRDSLKRAVRKGIN